MPEVHHEHLQMCTRTGCTNGYQSDKWNKHRAAENGWFLQRNGDSWCPDHHPEWVAVWRARHQARQQLSTEQ